MIPDLQQAIIFIAPEGREQEVVTRLSRVGYDNTLGFLEGGITAWTNAGKEIETIAQVNAATTAELAKQGAKILDVRKASEFEAEHVKGARNLPLDFINENFTELDPNETWYVHCAGGYRSVIFQSILKARGYHNLIDVAGGFKALAETEIEKTAYVCPSTLK
jgi:rhodanese-related sulfurtransferase